MVAWMCQNSIDAAALRHGRQRGSRRSRADPDRPVTSLTLYHLTLFSLNSCRAGNNLFLEQSWLKMGANPSARPRHRRMREGSGVKVKKVKPSI